MKQLETLPKDIYELFNPEVDHVVNEDFLNEFAEGLKQIFRTRLRKYEPPKSPLRFSSLGKPDRQIWFAAHPEEVSVKEEMIPKTYIKFLYGDLIEAMLLYLAKEAGHSVEQEQAEVDVDGVKGHIDAIIDGTVVDVKSASPYGYRKFAEGTVTEDDPFGYVAQLAGYATVLTPGREAAWLANEKVTGDICISTLKPTVIKHHDPAVRIAHLREVIASDEVPPLCYEPVADGKSGNYKLPVGCSYCADKFRCYPNLRTFIYSTGPRYLTTVVKTPDVYEIKKEEVIEALQE